MAIFISQFLFVFIELYTNSLFVRDQKKTNFYKEAALAK